MRAIIIAADGPTTVDAGAQRRPAAMLPLLDRPFVQHVVEFLVTNGITRIDFVLSHMPEKIESWFGEGDRWGATFNYHLTQRPDRPYKNLKAITIDDADMPILLVHGDRLPMDEEVCRCPALGDALPKTFVWREGGRLQGTGWAWVLPAFFKDIPADLGVEEFEELSVKRAKVEGHLVEVPPPLSARTYPDLLESHRRVFRKEATGLLTTGREVEPGIWISRNVGLPSSVKLTPPVYLGADSRIGQGVALGPNVVVGEGSLLDRCCTVRDSLIFAGSYVGESLELADLIVDRNRVVNIRLGVDCPVFEDFIIGSMEARPVCDWFAGVFSRVVAAGLLAIGWPILLLTAAYLKIRRTGPVLRKKEFIRLPASHNPTMWAICRQWSFSIDAKHTANGERRYGLLGYLLLDFLPALVNIVKGELHFVGVRPRNAGQLEQLPGDWRELTLRSKAGLITEAFVRFGRRPSEDEMYSAEAFYTVRTSVRYDLKLMAGWLGRILFGAADADSAVATDRPANAGKRVEPDVSACGIAWPEANDGSVIATLETTSDFGSLERIRAFVGQVCREELRPLLDEEDVYKAVVAVHEAATNVMRHAYHGSTDGAMRFEAAVEDGRLTFRIFHWGDGFDPRCAEEPRLDVPQTGGFGLYIISRWVDDTRYFQNGKGAQCVALTINLLGGLDRGSSNRENFKRDDHRVAVREN